MIETGLVSVTFRGLSVEEVISAAKQAGLTGIEWGGDIHVPPGNQAHAAHVRALTEAAGLKVFAYGSYYRPGEDSAEAFHPVLETAIALGAPSIRVWAGGKWTHEADDAYIARVVQVTQEICDLAVAHGIQICYEYHGWTLTDGRENACAVYEKIQRPNMRLYWQPNFVLSQDENLLALQAVMPHLRDVHVFYWDPDQKRFPLQDGAAVWAEYLTLLQKDTKDHRLMLEFVNGDCVEQLCQDAAALHKLL